MEKSLKADVKQKEIKKNWWMYLKNVCKTRSKTFNKICNVKRGVCSFHFILVDHRIPDFRVSTAITLSCQTFSVEVVQVVL